MGQQPAEKRSQQDAGPVACARCFQAQRSSRWGVGKKLEMPLPRQTGNPHRVSHRASYPLFPIIHIHNHHRYIFLKKRKVLRSQLLDSGVQQGAVAGCGTIVGVGNTPVQLLDRKHVKTHALYTTTPYTCLYLRPLNDAIFSPCVSLRATCLVWAASMCYVHLPSAKMSSPKPPPIVSLPYFHILVRC